MRSLMAWAINAIMKWRGRGSGKGQQDAGRRWPSLAGVGATDRARIERPRVLTKDGCSRNPIQETCVTGSSAPSPVGWLRSLRTPAPDHVFEGEQFGLEEVIAQSGDKQ